MEQAVNWKDVLRKTREHFGKSDRCLGWRMGDKRTAREFTGRPALIVYVEKIKEKDKIPAEEFVPPKLAEFKDLETDVVEPFSATREKRYLDYVRDDGRSHDLAALNFGKINRLGSRSPGRIPALSSVSEVGSVVVLEDRDGQLIARINGEEVLDLVAAYRAFQDAYGDDFHWLSFFADEASGVPTFDTSFQLGIYNNVEGIGLPPVDYRGEFGGSDNLQSIHFIHSRHMNRYVMLQEVGHQWCAFARFRERRDGPLRTDLLIQNGGGAFSHWNIYFDDDRSPVDYDEVDWRDNSDGSFTPLSLTDRERSYCSLDLYLMGLIPPDQVGNFYYLSDLHHLGGARYRATRHLLNVQNVLWAENERKPKAADSQKEFRHSFVLVTRDAARAESLAHAIDRFRRAFVGDFADATRDLARVNTEIRPAPPIRSEQLIQILRDETPIPDKLLGRAPVGIQRRMFVGDPRPIQGIEVGVEIRHSYVDDLEIRLTGPDGTSPVLRKFQEDGREVKDLLATYTPDSAADLKAFIGKPARGEWILSVTDLWEEDEGVIQSWTLKFSFQA